MVLGSSPSGPTNETSLILNIKLDAPNFFKLYQHGFKATVATLGTALSSDHGHILKRFAEEVIVIYDGDEAGQAAALRGLEILLENGLSVKLVDLPKGLDPDDYISKFGKEALWVITAEKFGPLLVTMDSHGNSMHDEMDKKVAANKADVYAKIGITE